MKNIVITLALVLVTSLAASAQKAQFIWDRKTMTEIGCSEDQILKVFKLKQAAKAERDAIVEDKTTSEQTKRMQKKELLERRNKAIMALLTPEQQKKARDMQKKIKQANKA